MVSENLSKEDLKDWLSPVQLLSFSFIRTVSWLTQCLSRKAILANSVAPYTPEAVQEARRKEREEQAKVDAEADAKAARAR